MGWALAALASILVLIVVAGVLWWYAGRMRRDLQAPQDAPPAAQPPLTFTLSERSTASLAHLSQEPIVIKQAEDGLRVQLDNRPLVPVSILTDLAAAAALREIVADASQTYGARWTALVMPSGDGSVTVQRLA